LYERPNASFIITVALLACKESTALWDAGDFINMLKPCECDFHALIGKYGIMASRDGQEWAWGNQAGDIVHLRCCHNARDIVTGTMMDGADRVLKSAEIT
jgi:hypothetical protein